LSVFFVPFFSLPLIPDVAPGRYFSVGGGEEDVEEDAAELEVTSVDFQPGDDIQRAYFDPECSEDPYNQVDVSNMFQSMDDPVRWETCEPVQDADAEPEARRTGSRTD
jgi:hypothetical protein